MKLYKVQIKYLHIRVYFDTFRTKNYHEITLRTQVTHFYKSKEVTMRNQADYSFKKQFVELPNNEKIAYIDQGTSEKVILLIHGKMASSATMITLIDALKDDYRVVAPICVVLVIHLLIKLRH